MNFALHKLYTATMVNCQTLICVLRSYLIEYQWCHSCSCCQISSPDQCSNSAAMLRCASQSLLLCAKAPTAHMYVIIGIVLLAISQGRMLASSDTLLGSLVRLGSVLYVGIVLSVLDRQDSQHLVEIRIQSCSSLNKQTCRILPQRRRTASCDSIHEPCCLAWRRL